MEAVSRIQVANAEFAFIRQVRTPLRFAWYFCDRPVSGTVAVRLSDGASQTEGLLCRFCPQAGCTDSAIMREGMVMDTKVNLYSTTQPDGTTNIATAFKI